MAPSSPDKTSNTRSAVKSWPASSSSINTDLASEKVNVVTSETVKSVLPESSISWLASAESDALIFSPTEKFPATFVKLTLVEDVPDA